MADEEHLKILNVGVEAWNDWRKNRVTKPDLRGADLSGADLEWANFFGADLGQADLTYANLFNTNFSGAALRGVNFSNASLFSANLFSADLFSANLFNANLSFARITDAEITGANLKGAILRGTLFADLNLDSATNLEHCQHHGPSIIDHRTLEKSGQIPLFFLRGCGLPEALIKYLPSLFGRAIEYYSCFISYSSEDSAFAERIHADLQNNGVRCWFAPEDMKIGDKILDTIDSAIRLRDKILLVLSEKSIASEWVEDEVTAGFEEERKRKTTVLFPIRLDDAVMDSKEAWAAKLRNRHIGDFRKWKDHDSFQAAFERLLRDLKKEDPQPAP